MKLKTIIEDIERLAPPAYQDEWDNSGLQVAAPQIGVESAMDNDICRIIVCLDVTEEVLDEAIETGADMIVSHHPLLFHGLKEVSDGSYQERCVVKAIRHGISIYSAHTSLDNSLGGVNHRIASILGLHNLRWLDTGAPAELPASEHQSDADATAAAADNHGAGLIGELSQPADTETFLAEVKASFAVKALKHSAITKPKVKTVALCGGAGAFLKDKAAEAGADCFICGEFHYHDWFDPGTMLIELGHYQSEQYTQDLLREYLSRECPDLVICRTTTFTDPEHWLL